MTLDQSYKFRDSARYLFFAECERMGLGESNSSDADEYAVAWESVSTQMRKRLESHLASLFEVEDRGAFFSGYWDRSGLYAPQDQFQALMHGIRSDINGAIYFYHWGRDCDLCESDSVHFFLDWYEASQWIQSVYDNAEGDFTVNQIDLSGYLNFERSFRDRGLEHFEEYGYGH